MAIATRGKAAARGRAVVTSVRSLGSRHQSIVHAVTRRAIGKTVIKHYRQPSNTTAQNATNSLETSTKITAGSEKGPQTMVYEFSPTYQLTEQAESPSQPRQKRTRVSANSLFSKQQ